MKTFLESMDLLERDAAPSAPAPASPAPSATDVNAAANKAWDEQWLVEPKLFATVAGEFQKFHASLKTLQPSDPSNVRLVSQFSNARERVSRMAEQLRDTLDELGESAQQITEETRTRSFGNVRPARLMETVGQLRRNQKKTLVGRKLIG